MSPPRSLLGRCTLLCHGHHLQRILLAQHGSMKGFGCNAIRCHIHHLIRGGKTLEGLCLTGCHDRCMTDWALTNQVRGNSPHRLPTDQTGLTRDQLVFILHDKSIASRRRRREHNPCGLIQRKQQLTMLCRLTTLMWLSRT